MNQDLLDITYEVQNKYCKGKKCNDCELNFRYREFSEYNLSCVRYYMLKNNIKIEGEN